MMIIKTIKELQDYRKNLKGSIGFIPTMGALHKGHASLMQRSVQENDHTIVSIFVNPTQFNNPKDLEKYPKTWDSDVTLLQDLKITCLFAPDIKDMYPTGYAYLIQENTLSTILCGATRPGHFEGVLTIVLKLFNLVQPCKSYFGEKDYQQYLLIQGMVEHFFLNIEVIACPLIREQDGLAMSSRNLRLTKEERALAPQLYTIIKENHTSLKDKKQALEKLGFKIDYLEEHYNRLFVAVFLGEIRLIDNVTLD